MSAEASKVSTIEFAPPRTQTKEKGLVQHDAIRVEQGPEFWRYRNRSEQTKGRRFANSSLKSLAPFLSCMNRSRERRFEKGWPIQSMKRSVVNGERLCFELPVHTRRSVVGGVAGLIDELLLAIRRSGFLFAGLIGLPIRLGRRMRTSPLLYLRES